MIQPRAVLLDVNETLLDLAALDPLFERVFGDARTRQEWFSQTLQSAFLSLALEEPRPFAEVGAAALQMVASRRSVTLPAGLPDEIRERMAALPPHPDVLPALARLQSAGITLAALTNNALELATTQMAASGLSPLLSAVFSAAEAGTLKPAPGPYLMAASRMNLHPSEVLFGAAHGWDVAGAARAGFRTVFIARPGQTLEPLFPPPDMTVRDVGELADRLLSTT
jgi:2-haloacid dehalogenase